MFGCKKIVQVRNRSRKRFNKVIFFFCILLCVCTKLYGQTYYVDAHNGDDNNSGLSPTTAWKTLRQVNITTFMPGDTILFCSGQEWEGMLFPRGSGEEGRPIVVSKYGSQGRPKIHGGHNDPMDFEGHRTIQTVLLYNQQHWVISDLEITNMPDNIIRDFDDNGYEKRRGIYVVAEDTGELRNIVIKNNYIHHVQGDDSKDFHGSGGIMVSVIGKKRPSFFNGVHILNNQVYMVNRTGIGVSSYWQRRPRIGAWPYAWMDEMGYYQANLNVVIRGNDLKSIGGDGIVPQTSFKPLVESNKVDGAAARSESYNAGLWAWNSDSALIQYNEVCNTHTVRDGMAFDCDAFSTGNIYQYNFTHHNTGGFILFFGYNDDVPDAMNIGHIIRYNLSVNDGQALVHLYGSGQTQSVIHNNLFYNDNPQVSLMVVDGDPLDIAVTRNIFYIPDMVKWTSVNSIDQFTFSNNILLKRKLYIPPLKGNRFRRAVYNDLYQLLNLKVISSGRQGETIHPEMISRFWYSRVKK